MLSTYQATCHCGAVEVHAELDLSQPTYRCNCSVCRRTRFWPAVALPGGFRIAQGQDALTRYTFGTGKNHHYFCRHCGVRVFGHGTETPMGEMYGVNLGCITALEDADLQRLAVVRIDGLHDRWSHAPDHAGHL